MTCSGFLIESYQMRNIFNKSMISSCILTSPFQMLYLWMLLILLSLLKVSQVVAMPHHHFPVGSCLTTLRLCSDGTYLYWVWSPVSINEKTQKGHSVFMDVFQLTVLTQECVRIFQWRLANMVIHTQYKVPFPCELRAKY